MVLGCIIAPVVFYLYSVCSLSTTIDFSVSITEIDCEPVLTFYITKPNIRVNFINSVGIIP